MTRKFLTLILILLFSVFLLIFFLNFYFLTYLNEIKIKTTNEVKPLPIDLIIRQKTKKLKNIFLNKNPKYFNLKPKILKNFRIKNYNNISAVWTKAKQVNLFINKILKRELIQM